MAGKTEETKKSVNISTIRLDDFNSRTQLTDVSSSEKVLDYDPFAERRVEHPNSDCGALAHLLKTSLGTGILAMPSAIKNAGTVPGVVLTIVIGFICTYCVNILVRSSHDLCRRSQTPSLTYAQTAEMAFKYGPKRLRNLSGYSRIFVDASLSCTYYSTLCVYVVFVATTTKQVADSYYAHDVPSIHKLDIRLYILMLSPIFYGLGLIRNLKRLVPFSIIANGFIVTGFCIILYYVFRDAKADTNIELVAQDFTTMPLFFSTVIFAIEGIGVVMPLENSMKNPSHFLGCPGVVNIGMTCVVLLYTVIGVLGYLKYGDDIDASISLNLPTEEVLAQVVKLLIAAALLVSYGLVFFVPTDIVWPMLNAHISERWKRLVETVFRLATTTVIVIVAIAVPNLGPIISLVGAVFFSTLGLICPAIIDTATNWEDGLGRWNWVLWKNLLIILFALLALSTGTYTSILDIIATY